MINRTNRATKRDIRHGLYGQSAASMIGNIQPNCEIFGLTKGDFSIINVIEHILDEIGTADVIISTWTAANVELKYLENFLANKKINNLHLIVDRSFETRQPKYYKMMVEKFGDIVSTTSTHAKFVLIRNENFNIVVRTSMNLNENKRIENFEISDDKDFYDYLLEVNRDIIQQKNYIYSKFKILGKDKKYLRYIKFGLTDEQIKIKKFLLNNKDADDEKVSLTFKIPKRNMEFFYKSMGIHWCSKCRLLKDELIGKFNELDNFICEDCS